MKTTTRRVGLLAGVGALFIIAGCGAQDPSQEGSVDNGNASGGDPSGGGAEIASTSQAVTNGWTPYTSEEYAPIVCDSGSLINAVQCSGDYCDNIRAYCAPSGGTPGYSYWTPYFSEEGSHNAMCSTGYWVTGISCRGDYCDNIAFQCTYIYNVSTVGCYTTGQVSEEAGGYLSFSDGYFARGGSCYGDYCDNKTFQVCRTH